MTEIIPRPGEWIGDACERLAHAAPAFMVFNGTRVEASEGEAIDDIRAKWSAERYRTTTTTERIEVMVSPEARAQFEAIMKKNGWTERQAFEACITRLYYEKFGLRTVPNESEGEK